MSADKDDIFSKPYEDWPGNESVKLEIERRKELEVREAFTEKVFSPIILVVAGLLFLSFFLDMFIMGERVFIRSEKLLSLATRIVVILVLSSFAFFLYAKLAKLIEVNWSGFVVFLLTSTFFVWNSVFVVAGSVITAVYGDEQEMKMVLYKSQMRQRRGCKVHNEFYLKGENASGSWCSSSTNPTGVYLVRTKTSSFGIIVMFDAEQK